MLDNADILEENEIKPTTEKSKSINAINKQTVHQICSGQVVLNLATAIKELVENSLDAGANAVEIKLKEYGKESVEVSDNGYGVEEENFQALTLKHHTSKLRDYSDLIGVGTFGFRGEALSSLCALSKVTIITRHKSVECGTRIEFDHNGIVMKKSPCARQIGTTVSLANIFSTLPVRQKEFHKNIKREFNKMTQLLYAYCLVASHAKITCSNQNKGNRTIIVSTQGNKGLRDNIVSVFGSKQIQGLIDIKPSETFIIESDEDPANNTKKKAPFEFEGVISSCDHDCGRSSSDRQFYYINSRPCEPNKIMKVVNEVYKQYNANQYPFIFLNIKVESHDVDVNVTPDKRQIFLNHEKLLLSSLKQTLIKLFENIPSTMKIQNKSLDTSSFNQLTFVGNSINNLSKKTSLKINESQGMKRKISFLERFTSSTKNIKLSHDTEQEIDEEVILSTPIENAKTPELSSDSEDEIKYQSNNIHSTEGEFNIKQKFENFFKNKFDSELSYKNNPVYMPKNVTIFHENHKTNDNKGEDLIKKYSVDDTSSKDIANNSQNIDDINSPHGSDSEINSIKSESDTVKYDSSEETTSVQEKKTLDVDFINNVRKTVEMKSLDDMNSIMKYQEMNNIKSEVGIVMNHGSSEEEQNAPVQKEMLSKENFISNIKRKTVKMKCSLDDIKSRMKNQAEAKSNLNKSCRIKFRSEILPSTNESAEKELDREISKEMFSKMTIIGQFNLGFIIVKFEDDLFIIDQHASDEKYNFESLQKSTVLQYQKLVIPQTLELTAVNESILMDNIDVFERNGFQFEIDESADTTRRVKLIGIPISKNVQFGKEDIDELLFMLQDYSGDNATCRPSRVRSMLASRACRKSVMVGTPMTKTDMRKLVDNMGTMEQPWNCPHGRPTMRHLVNLFLLNKSSDE